MALTLVMDTMSHTLVVHTNNHIHLLKVHHLSMTMTENHPVTLVAMGQGVMVFRTRRILSQTPKVPATEKNAMQQIGLLLEDMNLYVKELIMELCPFLSPSFISVSVSVRTP